MSIENKDYHNSFGSNSHRDSGMSFDVPHLESVLPEICIEGQRRISEALVHTEMILSTIRLRNLLIDQMSPEEQRIFFNTALQRGLTSIDHYSEENNSTTTTTKAL